MKTSGKICFIINPSAGGFKHNSSRVIEEFYKNNSVEPVIVQPKSKDDVKNHVLNAINSGCYAVVAAGGDGTVNEVAKALIGSNVALGIIPMGSGNGLARHHKIPLELKKALDVVDRNNQVDHDAIHINNYISFNVSGIGFDAHVAHLFGKNGQRGFKSYVKLTINEFNKYRNFECDVSTNSSSKKYAAMMISIANSSQFGNNAFIAPDAITNDGKLNLTIVKKMSYWKLPAFAIRVFNKTVGNSSHANLLEGEKFTLKCNNQIPLHIDGEPAGFDNTFSIQIIKNAIKLIVP